MAKPGDPVIDVRLNTGTGLIAPASAIHWDRLYGYEDEGPDAHDCVTAAHLRECGFCRAVLLTPSYNQSLRLDRVYETLSAMFEDDEFWRGSDPYRVWHRMPPKVTTPVPPPKKRKWWQL